MSIGGDEQTNEGTTEETERQYGTEGKSSFGGDMVVTKVSFVVDRNCRDENSDSQSRGDGVAVARIYANAKHVEDNDNATSKAICHVEMVHGIGG